MVTREPRPHAHPGTHLRSDANTSKPGPNSPLSGQMAALLRKPRSRGFHVDPIAKLPHGGLVQELQEKASKGPRTQCSRWLSWK